MDEITVDMDVLGRMDLLEFFKQECEQRGATIIYATHIFDGLEQWITHIAYMEDGTLVKGELRAARTHTPQPQYPSHIEPHFRGGPAVLHQPQLMLERAYQGSDIALLQEGGLCILLIGSGHTAAGVLRLKLVTVCQHPFS